ncbi:M42 family metallopeptidase [Schlesneria paludicola]|uniref:M42 family metallopeptidase n=1 Tax=Schlesneria paludicola TaxID=360056 RepID=UPI00029B166D|nr:M42 family metallopeptidase [Schlesneria paludicola]
MDSAALQFLKDLLHAPSPSGYERPVQDVVRRYAGTFADEVRTDWHGNVIVAVNPTGSPRIMLAGHCDQIGLLVKHIDDRGFLWVHAIGGWDPQVLIGQDVQVWTKTGPVAGVIARKPIHLQSPEDRKTVPEIKNLWVDIAVKDGEEARSLVAIGDPITVQLGYRELRNGLAAAPGMDNKVGAWTVISAAERVRRGNPKAAVFAVSTVQEEIGLRGVQTSAHQIDPQLGIVVDVTHATDCPTIDENQYGRVKLGKGPVLYRGPNVNPVVFERLIEQAGALEMPVQINGLATAASNDAAQLQLTRGGVATGLVCIPNRYMHSPVEVVSLEDLDHAAELIARFCLSVDSTSDFTP